MIIPFLGGSHQHEFESGNFWITPFLKRFIGARTALQLAEHRPDFSVEWFEQIHGTKEKGHGPPDLAFLFTGFKEFEKKTIWFIAACLKVEIYQNHSYLEQTIVEKCRSFCKWWDLAFPVGRCDAHQNKTYTPAACDSIGGASRANTKAKGFRETCPKQP